jgi:predicted CopG family antitoxin
LQNNYDRLAKLGDVSQDWDDVHRELGELGKLSESYSDVIRRLISENYELEKLKGTTRKGKERND